MKIALFYRKLDQGGIQRMMVNIANYLNSKGEDVSLVLMHEEGEYLELLQPGIKILPFESTKKSKLFFSFYKIFKREKFDVLFTASPAFNIIAIISKIISRNKTRIFISERNNTISLFRSGSLSATRLTFLFIPFFYRFADGIITVSNGLREQLSKVALIPKEKIKTIYNPAFTDALLEQANMEVKHPWLTNKTHPVIIIVSRFSKAKNHILLINSIKKVLEERQVRLIIVGEGVLRKEIEEEIKKLGLQDFVDLVGFQLNPTAWVAKSDIFVLASDFEGFGNVLVEALATGITIVTTDCNYGPAEIINYGEYGYLTPVGDTDKMAETILYALDNPLNKDIVRERARSFHVNTIMEQYLRLFKGLT